MNRSSEPQKTASFHHELSFHYELTRLNTRWHLDRLLLEEKRRLNFLCSGAGAGLSGGAPAYRLTIAYQYTFAAF